MHHSLWCGRGIQEMNVEEVGRALGIPDVTVRTRYFRTRSLLRESISRDIDMSGADAFYFDGARCERIVAGVLAKIAGTCSRRSASGFSICLVAVEP